MKTPANGNCFTICRFIYDRIFISYPYRDHASFTLPTVSLIAPLSLSHFPSSFNPLLLLIALFFFYSTFTLSSFPSVFFRSLVFIHDKTFIKCVREINQLFKITLFL